MLFPLIVVLAIIGLVIVVSGIAKKNPKVLRRASMCFWLMAVASAIPVVWAWSERAYSENWAVIGVIFISIPLILLIVILGAVLLIAARRWEMLNMRATTTSLSLLGAFLALQVVLILMTVR